LYIFSSQFNCLTTESEKIIHKLTNTTIGIFCEGSEDFFKDTAAAFLDNQSHLPHRQKFPSRSLLNPLPLSRANETT
jgi:hypothetical protein